MKKILVRKNNIFIANTTNFLSSELMFCTSLLEPFLFSEAACANREKIYFSNNHFAVTSMVLLPFTFLW